MITKIAMAADENYVVGAACLIASIGRNTDSEILRQLKIHFAFEQGSISPESVSFLDSVSRYSEIAFHSEEFTPLSQKSLRHITSTTFAKFYFLETSKDPFLWMDTDTVVLPGWAEILAAGKNFSSTRPYIMVSRPDGGQTHPNAGIFASSGVFPILDWQSRLGTHKQSLEQHIFQNDMASKSLFVPSDFNQVSIWGNPTSKHAVIRHYAGPIKPWHLAEESDRFCLGENCSWAPWFESWNWLVQKMGDENNSILRKRTRSNLSAKRRLGLSFASMTARLTPSSAILSWFTKAIGYDGDTHPLHKNKTKDIQANV